MFAYTVPAAAIGDAQVDIKLYEKGQDRYADTNRQFAYWRKFNHLHGWMATLYRDKGGADERFNCNTVRLMLADLDKLERDAPHLEPAEGFFWGEQDSITPENVAEVMKFVKKARKAIAKGLAVIYRSWW